MKYSIKVGNVSVPVEENVKVDVSEVEITVEYDSTREFIELVKVLPGLFKGFADIYKDVSRFDSEQTNPFESKKVNHDEALFKLTPSSSVGSVY